MNNTFPRINAGLESGPADFALSPSLPGRPATITGARWLLGKTLQWGSVVGLALGSYLLITHFLVQLVQVQGPSMSPTLKNTERLLLNRLVLLVRPPHHREIVVLRDPSDHGYAVKRVIACEGDTVCIHGGHLYVNGRETAESYLPRRVRTFMPIRDQNGSWVCRPGEYFVLGDNRDNSTDSRDYGVVPRRNILGSIAL